MRLRRCHRSAPRPRAERPEAQRSGYQARVDPRDGRAPSQDPGRLPHVPHGYPTWTYQTFTYGTQPFSWNKVTTMPRSTRRQQPRASNARLWWIVIALVFVVGIVLWLLGVSWGAALPGL